MNWQSFKAFYELYSTGVTRCRPTLVVDDVFYYHTNQTKELLTTKKDIIVVKQESFKTNFERLYLKKYNACLELLETLKENTPQCRFEVDDILALRQMKEQMDNGDLEEIRLQIIESNETRRGVSLMFFRNEKHLDSSEALERAVKTILKIDFFADDRDFQYLYVLHCHTPKAIVLCENLYFLKMPEKPRTNNIELWYAGGRNIEKLTYVDSRDLPIYYICDWDHDGLDIYKNVCVILPNIKLLTPNGAPKDIEKTKHKSNWKNRENPHLFSGLPPNLFSDEQQNLVEKLISQNAWIVEESNDLMALLSTDK